MKNIPEELSSSPIIQKLEDYVFFLIWDTKIYTNKTDKIIILYILIFVF
jgi:hypothetical protein